LHLAIFAFPPLHFPQPPATFSSPRSTQGAPSLSIHGVSSPFLGPAPARAQGHGSTSLRSAHLLCQRYSFLSMADSSREPPAAMAELLGSTPAPCSSPWPSPLVQAPLPLGRCHHCVCGVAGRSSSHGRRCRTLLHGRRSSSTPPHGATPCSFPLCLGALPAPFLCSPAVPLRAWSTMASAP
jgi:hypothetical protein